MRPLVRTDATRFCPHCVVRFGHSERCPQCDHAAYDLGAAPRRREALKAIARGSLGRAVEQGMPLRLASGWLNHAFLPLCGAGFVLGALQVGTLQGGVAGVAVAAVTQVALLLTGLALFFSSVLVRSWLGKLGDGSANRERRAELRLAPSAVPPSTTRLLEGVVRAEDTLASPLAHQACVAYRLAGRGPMGAIDDGMASCFSLETDEGTLIRVEASPCTLDLPVKEAPRALRPDRELTLFLQRRGVFPERGPLHLAEGLLRDGDRVSVEGEQFAGEASDGYRDTRTLRVIRETRETPLRIRRVSSEDLI